MAAIPFVLPRQVILDDSGDPVSGAKLFFYIGGTTTPQDTYTTKALSVAHDNPVIADAGGEVSAIYLDADKTYRVIVKTSADVTIYDEDNINDVTFRAPHYAQTTAESSAGVTPTDKSYYPGNIKRYGALIDGSTDDTAAWQAAADQCAQGGAAVFHPGGTSMAAKISYQSGVHFYGVAGISIVKCLPNQANFDGRVFTSIGADIWDSANDSAPVVWNWLIVDGNKANQGTYTGGEKEHNAGIFLGAAANSGGRLVARIDNCRFQNITGDGFQVHSNVDATITNVESYKCWRSGGSITGGYTKVRGHNWRFYGDSTDRSDFDIEVDSVALDRASYNDIEQIDVELVDVDVEHGNLEIAPASATETSSQSRILVSGLNHRGVDCIINGRGSVVKVSDSVLTFGPWKYDTTETGTNRVSWPKDTTFDNVRFVFTKGTYTGTTLYYAVDVFHNNATSDTNNRLRFINCRYTADSTVVSGDSVYGISQRAQAASTGNAIEIDGGHFDSTLDGATNTLGGGVWRFKGSPFFDCATGISLTYSGTDFWDVEVHGPIEFGSNLTTYLAIDQGHASNVLKHYGLEMDEAYNVLSDVGGSPGSNTYRGRRVIYVASAPGAATHGNVGDVARIKAPAAAGIVDYVCTTRGVGSGAVWKALTTAAA